LTEAETNDHAPIREVLDPDKPAQDPHQMVRVEVLISKVPRAPLVTPIAEGINYRAEFLPGGSEEVHMPPPVCGDFAVNDAGVPEGVQAIRKQIARHARDATMQVSEAASSGEQLPQDEGSPAFSEHFGGERYGTELAISLHAPRMIQPEVQRKFNF
jgi:hypothetical protein